jgi:hypothetical protein
LKLLELFKLPAILPDIGIKPTRLTDRDDFFIKTEITLKPAKHSYVRALLRKKPKIQLALFVKKQEMSYDPMDSIECCPCFCCGYAFGPDRLFANAKLCA